MNVDSIASRFGPTYLAARCWCANGGAAAPRADDGWIRAVGYHDSVAGELDRHRLDELFARAPVRIQHRSGAMWIVNTPGLIALGWPDHPTARFFRQDNTFAAVTAAGPILLSSD